MSLLIVPSFFDIFFPGITHILSLIMMINNGVGFFPPITCYPCMSSVQPNTPKGYFNPIPTDRGLKLYDFDGTKANEIIRLIFTFVGVPFKDKRVKEDEWTRVRERIPIAKLPILRVNNQLKIYDLHSIVRYLAREFRLYGQTNEDQAIVDMIFDLTCEFQKKFFEQIDRATDADHGMIFLNQLEKLHQIFHRRGPFCLGSQISFADLMVYQTINYLLEIQPKLLDNYPRLQQMFDYFDQSVQLKNGKTKKKRHRTVPPSARRMDEEEDDYRHRPRSHDEPKHQSRETILFIQKKRPPKEEVQSPDLQTVENPLESPEQEFKSIDQQSSEIASEEKLESNDD